MFRDLQFRSNPIADWASRGPASLELGPRDSPINV
jgi:hypothetical protein